MACEDDITELHAELAKTRLELTKVADENLSNRNELCSCRKVRLLVSMETMVICGNQIMKSLCVQVSKKPFVERIEQIFASLINII